MADVALQKPRQMLKNHWQAWVDKRSPRGRSHLLHHKNLYILPTATGWAFLLLALIIWLLGTNYQNNLILALSYFQVSLIVVVILHTYNNMSGLSIDSLGSDGGHAGQVVDFKFSVGSANPHGCQCLKLAWDDAAPALYDIEPGESQIVRVGMEIEQRGRYRPGRLLAQSDFPLGLVRCWTWLRFDSEAIVYPRILECALPVVSGDSTESKGEAQINSSGEEFLGYQQYRPGDALHRIAWKQYARERGLYSKRHGGGRTDSDHLSWDYFFTGDVERAVSQMTYWAVTWHEQNRAFSVTLPTASVTSGSGDAHLAQALTALALHGQH